MPGESNLNAEAMKHDGKIQELWARGVRDRKVISKKLGYKGGSMTAGLQRVDEAITRLGLSI